MNKVHVFGQELWGRFLKHKKKYYISVYIDGKGHMEIKPNKKVNKHMGRSVKWDRYDRDWVWVYMSRTRADSTGVKLRFEAWRHRRFWRDKKEGSTKVLKFKDLMESTSEEENEDKQMDFSGAFREQSSIFPEF